jgi:predicted dehydrogenase
MAVRLGILGFAHGHVAAYCRQWRDRPDLGVEVRCGWDHDTSRLAASAERLSIETTDSANALLARDDVDGVVIAAETSLHAELVEQAAAAGKPIVLQKPMALTMAQADRIAAAVASADVPFTMAWQMRVDPQNRRISELLAGGVLGKLYMVRRRHGLGFLFRDDAAESWHTQAKWNRDLWADDAAHPVDFLYWLLGMPETVTAELATLRDPRTPNDNGIAIYRYAEGPLAEVCCAFANRAGENTVEIVGEHGTIIQNFGDAVSCNVPRSADAPGLKWYLHAEGKWIESGIPTPAGHSDRLAGLAEPLAGFFAGGNPIATADEGRDALRMVLATYVSAREGRRVAMNDPKIDHV